MPVETYVRIENLRIRARHGVLPQERVVGGDFVVTLRIGYPWQRAMTSDDVGDTLDYSAVSAVASDAMAVASCTLEHAAGRMAQALLRRFPRITSIDLWLTKTAPPMKGDCDGAGVELHLINDKSA